MRRLLGAVFLLLALGDCGRGDLPLETVDPEAVAARPTYAQIQAILERSCVPCHGSGTKQGSFDYSTCEGTRAGLQGLESSVLDSGSMPPGAWPRLSEAEKLLLLRWLRQGSCSPCSSPCP